MNNYKLLPALVSILTTKNLTESAKDLNVTQSARSKTLSQIRQALPLHIAAEFSKKYSLQIKPLPMKIKPHQYYLLWHVKYQQDSEHVWFRELCLPILKNYLESRVQEGMKLLHASQ